MAASSVPPADAVIVALIGVAVCIHLYGRAASKLEWTPFAIATGLVLAQRAAELSRLSTPNGGVDADPFGVFSLEIGGSNATLLDRCVTINDMPDPVQTAVDIAELARLLKKQRADAGMSLRDVSAETGVPYSTLARVETGKIPDLNTFRSIVAWLGIPPERFFPTSHRRTESTPDFVAHALRDDASLSDSARDQLVAVFSQMYATLSAKAQPVTVHLRADRAFTPEAGNLLADVLQQMEQSLLRESAR